MADFEPTPIRPRGGHVPGTSMLGRAGLALQLLAALGLLWGAQAAVFFLRTLEGSAYVPPPPTGVFNDVPVTSPYAPWIEELFRRGITGGCGGGNFCPSSETSRAQAAVLVVRTFACRSVHPRSRVRSHAKLSFTAVAAENGEIGAGHECSESTSAIFAIFARSAVKSIRCSRLLIHPL